MAIDMKASIVHISRISLAETVDWYLITFVLALMSFGLVMVASASIDLAAHTYRDPWFFVKRHVVFLSMGLIIAAIIVGLPSVLWNRLAIVFLLLGLALLVAVLIPGVGKVVNGSRRWLGLGFFSLQASEAAKFCFIIFFASFLARRMAEFREGWGAFFKLLFILAAFVGLLLMEPDFGSSVVLCIIAATMMFIAGVPILRFLLLSIAGFASLAFIAVASPYRWQRLVTFLDPWSDQFSSGYQLVQSLIAFGRGEWMGLGLGNSLQKLFFLPEAHTDFIFSIIAEEFGLLGALSVVVCFVVVVTQILKVAYRAYKAEWYFALYCCVGIASLFAAQAFINMGVASGLLPTKGLTLPFVSSGGSSLLVSIVLIAIILRFDWEMRTDNISDLQTSAKSSPIKTAGHKKSTETQQAPGSRRFRELEA